MEPLSERERANLLIDIGLRLAQELQEFVDDAVVATDDVNALLATQELLKDWERVYGGNRLL